MGVKTPDWLKHALFYQIFRDRLSRSPRRPDALRPQPYASGSDDSARHFEEGAQWKRLRSFSTHTQGGDAAQR